ncbi:UBX domain-containing protein 10 [Extremus antarcticus]|uniref:UBX domain-containing protein 10 n=1 Tax=Extremus antarcticus TaxID=702011 RepID=A0AAJ0LW40_9PEZI|nr:UBX domain-containing protein 10 [Extremus antarcticus]
MADGAIDLTALTESQQLALQQFTSVTDQDLASAVPLLQKCQWNAQIAITRFFDGDAETIDPAAEAARAPPPPSNSRRTETLLDTIPARTRPRHNNASDTTDLAPRVVPVPESQRIRPLPFPLSLIFLPFNLTYTLLQRTFSFFGYLFPFLPRLLARFRQPSRDTGRRPLNPRDTAARFMREFEEEHNVPHTTLPFHDNGYADAFDRAKRDLRYLLVVLLSPEHDDNAPFVRETLLSDDFTTLLNTSQNSPEGSIILWAGTVQDSEAYQVASAFNVTRFPFVALIAHTPSVSATAMSRLTYISGPITAQELVAQLQKAMQEHGSQITALRAQRREQEATRNLRQEQESAYERSLAQDREKARRKKGDAEEKEKSEREERERGERKADAARRLAQWRRWRAHRITPEPAAEEKEAVRVSLRMMGGERVIRRFKPDTPLEELYAFVECYDVLNDEAEANGEKTPSEPEVYEHEFKFRLVAPMPREVFELEKGGTIRERIGRSGNLIVEKIVGEDDSDDEDDDDDEE